MYHPVHATECRVVLQRCSTLTIFLHFFYSTPQCFSLWVKQLLLEQVEFVDTLCIEQFTNEALLLSLSKYTKPPECVEYSAVHHEVFPAGALEARVRRASVSGHQLGKTSGCMVDYINT